jgi:hypothetical protein
MNYCCHRQQFALLDLRSQAKYLDGKKKRAPSEYEKPKIAMTSSAAIDDQFDSNLFVRLRIKRPLATKQV